MSNRTNSSFSGLMPIESLVPLLIAYILTTTLAVCGNSLVIVVFSCGKRSRSDLRGFLINLAVADLVMAIFCTPFTFTHTIMNHWPFSNALCPLVLYMQLVSVTASVCTNTALGFDRFWIVAFPLKSRLTKSRVKVVILMIWLIALSASSVQLFIGRAVTNGTNTKPVCKEDWKDDKSRQIYTFFVLLTTYVVPLTILTATYGMVGVKLWQRTTPGNADQARDMQQLKSKRKVIKMLVVIVALFAICWLPLHLFMIIIHSAPSWTERTELQPILNGIYYTVHWLAMSNSCVNPIVYSFLNDSFRADLKRLVRRWCNCFKGPRDGKYARTFVRDYSRSDRASLKGCDTNRRLLSSRNQHEDGGELGQVVIVLRNVGERQRDEDLNRL